MVNVPDRLRWTVDLLDVRNADRLLEIGCGRGVAAELVCDRLTSGKLVAVERCSGRSRWRPSPPRPGAGHRHHRDRRRVGLRYRAAGLIARDGSLAE